jgi:hypothetical protein
MKTQPDPSAVRWMDRIHEDRVTMTIEGKTMTMTIEGKTVVVAGAGGVRELDRRTSDGIDVSLLWHSQTNSVTLAVHDECDGHRLEFEVDPAQALRAFQHPYAYAPRLQPNRALTRTPQPQRRTP